MNASILKLTHQIIFDTYTYTYSIYISIYMYLLLFISCLKIISIQSSSIGQLTNNSLHLHPPVFLFPIFSPSSLQIYCRHHIVRCPSAHPQYLNLSLCMHHSGLTFLTIRLKIHALSAGTQLFILLFHLLLLFASSDDGSCTDSVFENLPLFSKVA